MAAAFVKSHAVGDGTTNSATRAPTSTIPVGNTAFFALRINSTVESPTISDTKGNTWTLDRSHADANGKTYVWSSKLTTALLTSDSVTASWSALTAAVYGLAEYSGLSGEVDQTASANGTGTAPSSGATPTLTSADDLVIGVCGWNSADTVTVGAGYTQGMKAESLSGGILVEHKVLSGDTSAQTATATLTGSPTWGMLCVTYKAGVAPRTIGPYGKIEVVIDATGTWFPPEGVTSFDAECYAGGGGGATGALLGSSGGGGGGGRYVRSFTTTPTGAISCTPGTGVTVTVGAGGAIGAAGGDSWVKTTGTLLAKGGAGGTQTAGGSGNVAGSVGATSISGGNGGTDSGANGGGGGGGAGDTTAGGNGGAPTAGTAGTAGGGAGGKGGELLSAATAGVALGGGGGGGDNGATNTAGKVGAAGRCIIRYTEVGNETTVTVPAAAVALVEPPATVTTVAAYTKTEALAETLAIVTRAVMNRYRRAVVASGPAVYWRMSNLAAGVSSDELNLIPLYVTAATLTGTLLPGDPDQAFAFDGATAFAGTNVTQYNPFVNGTKRTIGGFYRRSSDTTLDMFWGGSGAGSDAPYLFAGGEFGFAAGDVVFAPSGNSAATYTWANALPPTGDVAMVFLVFEEDIDVAELFVNGVSKGQKAVTVPWGATGEFNYGIFAGLWVTGSVGAFYWHGTQDEFAIWHRALTATEIADLWAASRTDASEAIVDRRDLTTVAAHTASEALAQTLGVTTVAVYVAAEALVEPPRDVTTVAVLTALEALAQSATVTTVALLAGLEALADRGDLVTIMVGSGDWQRVSPGLSGVVYDESGTTPIPGAQVLVFRDDNTLVATLTSDALGLWALDLNPAYSYWVSGWLDGATQIEDETDRHITPVETVVETGTMS